jgi:predicted P-loop ATPase/GTPase
MSTLNLRLINEVAVSVVYVQGPTTDLQMSATERVQIGAEIQTGLNWLAAQEPDAKVSFIFDDQKSWRTVWLNAEPFPNAPWAGLPREMYQKGIDAALWRDSNQKIYMFYGNQYVRLTGTTVDAGYPQPIAGNWNGLPTEFTEGIDAAFWNKNNNKIYMFKGDQYVRLTETTMDAGYPQPIAGNWNGVPSEFAQGIDAVFMHHGTNKIYMFKGDQYIRITGTTMDANFPKPIKGNFQGVPDFMEEGIQAALWRGSNDKLYLFGKHSRRTLTEYVRFSDISQPIDAGYPQYVGGLDKAGAEALWRDPTQSLLGVGPGITGYEDYVDQLRADLGTDCGIVAFVTKYPVGWFAYAGPPKLVMAHSENENFDRVFAHETGHLFWAPDEYKDDCDCEHEYGHFLKAKNSNCKSCTTSISMDLGYPKVIANDWHNLPVSFQTNLDAALWRDDNKKVYLFKGSQYVRLTDTTMDAGFPAPIAGNWGNMPANFANGIDAAVWRKSNNRIYMFKGSEYVRITGTTVDAGFPQPIAGNWNGLPASFTQGIDAAVWRESNDKIYLFKGTEYVRLTETTMDAGFPKPIAGNWKGLPASFTNGISAGLMHRDKGKMYLFDGHEYARMVEGENCVMWNNTEAMCDFTPIHLGWGAFMTNIDAAVWRGDNNKAYLFSKGWYVRYSNIDDGIDEGFPAKISDNWVGLPDNFASGIDAALYRSSNNKLYFFKGNQYVRLTGSTVDAGFPQPIAGNWNGLPASFEQGIDAAFERESNGKIYMFKGDQYVRLTETEVDPGYPQPIAGNWPDLPSTYNDGIDAALMRVDTSKIYFFHGHTYIRYSNVNEGVDAGYPKWINNNWMPFPT